MPNIDDITKKMLSLGCTDEGKAYVRHLIEDEVWYTGGDVCPDCDAYERYNGVNGLITGILVAHDKGCPYFNGVTR